MHRIKVEFVDKSTEPMSVYEDSRLSLQTLEIDYVSLLTRKDGELLNKEFEAYEDFDLLQNLDFWDRLVEKIKAHIDDSDDELSFSVHLPDLDHLYFSVDLDDDEVFNEPDGEWTEEDHWAYRTEQKQLFSKIVSERIAPAAEKGFAYAQMLLGDYYSGNSPFFRDDKATALKWYRKAAYSGLTDGIMNLYSLYSIGDYAGKMLLLCEEAAACGDLNAKAKLAEHYLKGFGVEKDLSRAAEIARDVLKCSWGDNSQSLWILGKCREETAQSDADLKAACILYWDASMRCGATEEAMCDLARCYENGIGTRQDKEEAFRWYQKSTNYYKIGYCYENGIGVLPNMEKAVKFYEFGAVDGSDAINAVKALVRCYENGISGIGDYWREELASLKLKSKRKIEHRLPTLPSRAEIKNCIAKMRDKIICPAGEGIAEAKLEKAMDALCDMLSNGESSILSIIADARRLYLAVGHGVGIRKGRDAARTALAELGDSTDFSKAKGFIVIVSGAPGLVVNELEDAYHTMFSDFSGEEVENAFLHYCDETLDDEAYVTILLAE